MEKRWPVTIGQTGYPYGWAITGVALAKQSIELRSRLGLEIEGTVGQLYLSACTEASNGDNPQRRGPRKLASWLLTEIQLLKMNDRDPGARN